MRRYFVLPLGPTSGTVVTYIAPPAGFIWFFHCLRLSATADLVVATRKIRVNHTFVADRQAIAGIMYGSAIAAGTTGTLAIGVAATAQGSALFATDGAVIQLTRPLPLQKDLMQLEINLDNGDAGDFYSGYLLFEEISVEDYGKGQDA